MVKTRRLAARLAVGALAAAGMVVGPATAANASLAGCGGSYITETWTTYCYGSAPSSFRAKANCYSIKTGALVTTLYGPWRYAGGGVNSSVTCSSGQEVGDGQVQTHL